MESKIISPDFNTKEELYALFTLGINLPGIRIDYLEPNKRKIYHKPFGNVLTSNINSVLYSQDFNGEPFLRGKFEYMQVLLPTKRTNSINHFYRVLKGILNGYHVCTKANKDRLISLANEIYHYYAPLFHVYNMTEERLESFQKIEDIIDKVIASPSIFKGRKKYEKIFWNPDYDLTPQEKTEIFNKERGKSLVNKGLKTVIKLYTEGMTQKELAEKSKLSLSTIKRRWKDVLEVYSQQKGYLIAA
ncbi:helix-turn-helix domain-containing protein [Mariniflexile soesokkakense]|uniref:Helix-turn-helix domain-containing protein n=1 Tax=Mariniflexile soesokkakense TaxID=1343160 RepID=A0ABV0AED1_9FLAO